jgi:hypothetical protein
MRMEYVEIGRADIIQSTCTSKRSPSVMVDFMSEIMFLECLHFVFTTTEIVFSVTLGPASVISVSLNVLIYISFSAL